MEHQKALRVRYKGKPVGDFAADLPVEKSVLQELIAVKSIDPSHENQLLTYLQSSGIEVGLLVNSAEGVQTRRKIFTLNSQKSA